MSRTYFKNIQVRNIKQTADAYLKVSKGTQRYIILFYQQCTKEQMDVYSECIFCCRHKYNADSGKTMKFLIIFYIMAQKALKQEERIITFAVFQLLFRLMKLTIPLHENNKNT